MRNILIFLNKGYPLGISGGRRKGNREKPDLSGADLREGFSKGIKIAVAADPAILQTLSQERLPSSWDGKQPLAIITSPHGYFS